MSGPSTLELLPGTAGPDATPPLAVCNGRIEIEKAQRTKKFRDLFDGVMLLALDYLFLSWPGAHVPFLNRSQSLTLLVALHVVLIGYWIISRELPPWRAKRIAATWAPEERGRMGRH
ncbi:MAG TPA: hypothetical protein VMS12_09950 [Thermoanaerobaculia bacterium]|nr:hypothetical protein [Thermoanaerobaculia bacterium]